MKSLTVGDAHTMSYKTQTNSRLGIDEKVEKVFDIGLQPLANALQTSSEVKGPRFPLSISMCDESKLIQLDQTIDRDILFGEYTWVTGTSKGAYSWAKEFVTHSQGVSGLTDKDLVLEIASNDGTYLEAFAAAGFSNILGVESASNIAEHANGKNVPTIAEFWSDGLARDISRDHGKAKLVVARNVIPHVSDLLGTISGIKTVMHADGVAAIEFHYAGKILDGLQYDSIYHEHLCYFSIESLTALLVQFNLHPFHLISSPISGGALVIFASLRARPKSRVLLENIATENNSGVNEIASWRNFSSKAEQHRLETVNWLERAQKKNIVGFGSSARSQTYLNYCDIGIDFISCIIDNNPRKQGCYTPGSAIPIVSIQEGLGKKPDVVFILAWNFTGEIVAECRSHDYQGEYWTAFPNKLRLF